ncbi:MAG: ABC transporter permease [Corallococcus sp.]|nr:ABC transporter permease [Bacillota bacterium]MCM1534051.1 ABC transporter permease [Corallococcus sp.]
MKKKLGRIFADGYLGLVLALLYLPIFLIIVFSFSGTSNFSFRNGFTFDSYAALFSGSQQAQNLLSALKNTLILAVSASVISTVLGTVSTIGIYYLGKRLKKITLTVNQLPMINSEVVMAVSLMVFFSAFSFIFPQGMTRLIIAHVAFCTPYVVLSILPRLQKMDPNMYEAALDLGSGPMSAILKVVIPFLAPGIVSGFAMAFTLSLDDFIITQFNKGDTGIETLSTYIYEDARVKSLEPFWFAVFSIFFVVMLTLLLVINIKKNGKKEAKV